MKTLNKIFIKLYKLNLTCVLQQKAKNLNKLVFNILFTKYLLSF